MDMVQALEATVRSPRRCWRARWSAEDPVLAGFDSVDELIAQVRQADELSDLIVRRLLARGPSDPFAAALVVASLVRLGLRRCRGDRDRLDALVSELAIVVGEAWAGAIPESDRRLAHVLVDRAWGRVRAIERKGRWARAVDLDTVADSLPASAPGPEHVVVSRVAFDAVLRNPRRRAE